MKHGRNNCRLTLWYSEVDHKLFLLDTSQKLCSWQINQSPELQIFKDSKPKHASAVAFLGFAVWCLDFLCARPIHHGSHQGIACHGEARCHKVPDGLDVLHRHTPKNDFSILNFNNSIHVTMIVCFLGVPGPYFPPISLGKIQIPTDRAYSWKNMYVGCGAANQSIYFKCFEENIGMISSKGSGVLREAAGWIILMFNGDSQLQPTRLPCKCKSCDKLLHQTSTAFLAAQKTREAFGERLCATCHDDNLALQGYDIPVQWTVVEGNLRNPHFYTSSFHALCSERENWKLDQLMSIFILPINSKHVAAK